MDRKLRKLERLQRRTNELLDAQNWDADTRTIAQPMKRAIATGKLVYDKYSVYTPDTRSLADREQSEFSVPLPSLAKRDSAAAAVPETFDSEDEDGPDDDKDLRDPMPDFDDSYPPELLDALIQEHEIQINTDEGLSRFEEAEIHQRRLIDFLDQRWQIYGQSYSKDEHVLRLARLLRKRHKYSDAGLILHNGLTAQDPMEAPQAQPVPGDGKNEGEAQMDARTIERNSDFWFDLAETRHHQWQAEENDAQINRPYRIPILKALSDTFAKRSYKLRLKIRDTCSHKFQESVELLQTIWEAQGAVLPAATLGKLYRPVPHQHLDTLPDADAPVSPRDFGPGKERLLRALATGQALDVRRIVREANGHDFVNEIFQQLHLNVDNMDSSMPSVLAAAIVRKDFKAVRILLEHGADVNQRDEAGTTLVMLAAQRDSVILALLCHRQPDLEAKDNQGKTALHYAMRGESGNEAVWTLLQYGAKASTHCCELGTPLHDAIVWRKDGYAQIILDNSSDAIEAVDRSGQTPLHLAITRHRYDITRLLLRRGALLDRTQLPDRGNVNMDFKRLLDDFEQQRSRDRIRSIAESPVLVLPSAPPDDSSKPNKRIRQGPMSLFDFAQQQRVGKERRERERASTITSDELTAPSSPSSSEIKKQQQRWKGRTAPMPFQEFANRQRAQKERSDGRNSSSIHRRRSTTDTSGSSSSSSSAAAAAAARAGFLTRFRTSSSTKSPQR